MCETVFEIYNGSVCTNEGIDPSKCSLIQWAPLSKYHAIDATRHSSAFFVWKRSNECAGAEKIPEVLLGFVSPPPQPNDNLRETSDTFERKRKSLKRYG